MDVIRGVLVPLNNNKSSRCALLHCPVFVWKDSIGRRSHSSIRLRTPIFILV